MYDTAQIYNYINNERSLGKTDLEIKQALLQAGWPEITVNKLFQVPSLPSSPRPFKKIALVVIVIIILVPATVTAFFALKNSQTSDTSISLPPETTSSYQETYPETIITPVPQATTTASSQKTRQYDPATLTSFSKNDLQKIGVITLPEGFQVQEEYKGIKLIKSPKKSYDQKQLGLLHYFLDLTPQKLLTPGPAAVVIYERGEVETGYFGQLTTVAFASGPYMFFNEDSFSGGTLGGLVGDDSVDSAFYAFEHELMHNAQFNENTNLILSKIDEITQDQPTSWTEIILPSTLFGDFAKIANWERNESDKEKGYLLKNKETEKTTEYGKTAIYEDIAETIAGIICAKDYEFSDTRKNWALSYLAETTENLKKNKFPFSTLFELVKSNFPTYDYNKKDAYKAKYALVDVEVFYQENANTFQSIKDYLEKELLHRGWQGTFAKEVKDDKVEIYKGDFIGNSRDIYIEIRTYDNAVGYSEKPTGTQIVVVSGYIKL